jgi:poly(A) polymerase
MQAEEVLTTEWLRNYPRELRKGLAAVGRICPEMYVSGGTIRDLLAGRIPHDLDLAVPARAMEGARLLARRLAAAFVPLDEQEEVGRVVWRDYSIDFCRFREATTTIEADLARRDFTINAMAVPLRMLEDDVEPAGRLLDPTGGLPDFAEKLIRATSDHIFIADPLRMLRAHRFGAALGFTLENHLTELIRSHRDLLHRSAFERISSELQLIMASGRAHRQFAAMASNGLLWVVFPELREGVGVEQPPSHHLDVFHHGLAALASMERLQEQPGFCFPGHGEEFGRYLEPAPRRTRLKWAALFHDLGKPAAHEIRNGRPTFYGHDRLGAERFGEIARRLRWSREESREVTRLIELHMWPFHLNNARLTTGITAKAILRLVKAVGDELPGLFLLAMADSLAGAGPGKPPAMEKTLADLYTEVNGLYRESIKPVFERPRLLSGHDLQQILDLKPGVLIGRLLEELEKAQVAGEVHTREEAVDWIWARWEGIKRASG